MDYTATIGGLARGGAPEANKVRKAERLCNRVVWIDHLHRAAGIIDLHDRVGRRAVAEGRVRPVLVGGKPLAEPIAMTLGMRRAVLLPQQRQRHAALAFQLLRLPAPLRLAQVPGAAAEPPEQGPLQRRLALVNP